MNVRVLYDNNQIYVFDSTFPTVEIETTRDVNVMTGVRQLASLFEMPMRSSVPFAYFMNTIIHYLELFVDHS